MSGLLLQLAVNLMSLGNLDSVVEVWVNKVISDFLVFSFLRRPNYCFLVVYRMFGLSFQFLQEGERRTEPKPLIKCRNVDILVCRNKEEETWYKRLMYRLNKPRPGWFRYWIVIGLRRNPLGSRVIFIKVGQKSSTRII